MFNLKSMTMKHRLIGLALVACSLLTCKCSDSDKTNERQLWFEATLTGSYTAVDLENVPCAEEGYGCHVSVDAVGTATEMGEVTLPFRFCACGPMDPAVSTEHQSYEGGTYVLTGEDGDELWLYSDGGLVIYGRTDEHPDYVVSYWQEKLDVVGGTGKFKGATGELTEDDYNSSLDPNSHHYFYGTITLIED